ncbi:MAG: hypothetical protein IKC26_09260 [Clostridia bacterium]|nr:hypothetical protein [Clostridia bacterium]
MAEQLPIKEGTEKKIAVGRDSVSTASTKARARRSRLSRFRPSALLDRFARWLYVLFTSGFFGRIFTAYSREESFFRRIAEKRRRQKQIHFQPKYTDRRLASVVEKLLLTARLKRLRYLLMKAPVGYYADAILSYALISLIANFLVTFLSGAPSIYEGYALTNYALETLEEYVSGAQFWVNVILFLLIAIFTLPIRSRSLKEMKTESFFLSAFFERLLGAKSELAEDLNKPVTSRQREVWASRAVRFTLLLLGAAAGVLSAFISPLYTLLILLIVLLVSIVIRTPEAGLVLSVLLLSVLPFFGSFGQLYTVAASDILRGGLLSAIGLPTVCLCAIVLLTGFSYLIKVLRKKRLFRFGLLDVAVLLLGCGVLLYGIFPHTTAGSVTEAVVTFVLMLVYFLSVNLLRTEAWISRVLAVLQFTLFSAMTVGIVVYFFGLPDLGWISSEYVTGEIGNVSVLFGGEVFLGSYLILMFPISLGAVFSVRSAACKIFAAMCLPEMLFVGALLESKLPLTFCLLGFCVFALFSTYKTLYTVPLAALGAGVVYQLFPNGTSLTVYLKGFVKRNFGEGIYLWDRLFTAPYELSLAGEGFGNLRFSELFARSDPFTGASFWIRTLVGVGIPGVLLYLLLLFILMQRCFEEMGRSRGTHLRHGLVGGFSALIVLLLYGAFMPIFADFRMVFLFWLAFGLTSAACRVSSDRRGDGYFLSDDPTSGRSVDTILS